MPFGVVSGVGLGMSVLDFGGDRRKERGTLGVNLRRPIVTNGAFATRSSQITLVTCYTYGWGILMALSRPSASIIQ